jgi:methylenetetrahydrofolate dehydrogenase (NADP+) / methenyltetrahydrofolate cyclohydrolase
MSARLLDGKETARVVRAELTQRVEGLRAQGIVPGLAVILVGDDAASQVYVRHKVKACAEVGLHSEVHNFPSTVSKEIVLNQIRALNENPAIHGILVQLPLPPQFGGSAEVVDQISVDKDVDGFHFYNLGGLIAGDTVFPPCTPYGVMRLLEQNRIPLAGQNAVVVGRSNIVGKPMALMLLQRDATVSICTSKTRDLALYTKLADILVVATGKAQMITGSMIKEGAVVIDVGINRLPDGRLVGDVDFDSVKEKASFITPVPGGVGPMTVTMLIANTVQSAERRSGWA